MLEHEVDTTVHDDGVITVRFVSSHRLNLMTGAMIDRLLEVVAAVADDRPRVVVVKGGDTAFSGGADTTELGGLADAEVIDLVRREIALFRAVELLPCITVAELRGPCIGSALELALACDFRVAADDVRIGVPEVALGFPAPVQRLARFLPLGLAKDLIFSGRLVGAHEAERMGLIHQVVPVGGLPAAVDAVVDRYRRLEPPAVQATKRLLDRAAFLDLDLQTAILDESSQALARSVAREA